jgi:hypothetical protein
MLIGMCWNLGNVSTALCTSATADQQTFAVFQGKTQDAS